jgi:hypothetical protein
LQKHSFRRGSLDVEGAIAAQKIDRADVVGHGSFSSLGLTERVKIAYGSFLCVALTKRVKVWGKPKPPPV